MDGNPGTSAHRVTREGSQEGFAKSWGARSMVSGPGRRHSILAMGVTAGLAVFLAACSTAPLPRQVILTDKTAKPGLFSQGIRVGNTVYVSGQLPIDPSTGQLVAGGIEEQTRQTLENIKSILQAAGYSLADVAACQVFIIDMADFPAMNKVYQTYFPNAPPARATVQVAGLARSARIEISAIAAK